MTTSNTQRAMAILYSPQSKRSKRSYHGLLSESRRRNAEAVRRVPHLRDGFIVTKVGSRAKREPPSLNQPTQLAWMYTLTQPPLALSLLLPPTRYAVLN